jgi:hypothetical protein
MHPLLLTLALVTGAQHPDSATFITRLGTDTIASSASPSTAECSPA